MAEYRFKECITLDACAECRCAINILSTAYFAAGGHHHCERFVIGVLHDAFQYHPLRMGLSYHVIEINDLIGTETRIELPTQIDLHDDEHACDIVATAVDANEPNLIQIIWEYAKEPIFFPTQCRDFTSIPHIKWFKLF